MKTVKTTTTAYEIENSNGNTDLIVGVSNGYYFVKTSDGIMQYTESEMQEVYEIHDTICLANISQVLNR
jgi:hypothetical protein